MKQSSDKTMQDPRTNKNDEEIIPSRDTSTNAHSFHLPHWIVILLLLFVPPVGWWHMWKNHRYHSWFAWVLWLNAAVTFGFAAYILVQFYPILTTFFTDTSFIFATHVMLLFFAVFEIGFGFYLVERCKNEMILRRRILALVILLLFINTIAIPLSQLVIKAHMENRAKSVQLVKKLQNINATVKPIPTSNQTTNLDSIGSDWKTYTNREHNFSLELPGDMTLAEENDVNASLFEQTWLRSHDFSIDNSSSKITKGWEMLIHVGKQPWTINKETVVFTETKQLNGVEMVIVNSDINDNFIYEATFTKNNLFYHLWFTTEKLKQSQAKQIFYQILSTFKFTDSAQ